MARRTTETVAAAAATIADPRWPRLVARDPDAEGRFWYSVRSTGVFCRPTCASRLPHPGNVRCHDSVAAAMAAGFRPCRRCQPERVPPDRDHARLVARTCRAIEAADTVPTLAALAEGTGLSPHHLHRVFRRSTGLTPRDYAVAHRVRRLRKALDEEERVLDAVFAAGFGSGARCYAEAGAQLGMTPGRYRKGGQDTVIRFAVGQCSLGAILVAASPVGVCAILLGDEPEPLVRDLQHRFLGAELVGADAGFDATVARVVAFVDAPRLGLDLPLDIRGTAFQQRVWRALTALPSGSTASYAAIARAIGQPASIRAVAGACAANALAVAIPCHRVVRTDGGLSGYRWGVERKRALLEREAAGPRSRPPP